MNFVIFSIICVSSHAMAAEVLVKDLKFKLYTGDFMPAVGLGTAGIGRAASGEGQDQEKVTAALDYALAAGYRQFDTAKLYGNEEHIGKALKDLLPKYNLTRQDIWITTKLSPQDQADERAYEALQESIRKLQSGYVDLYLIHWPGWWPGHPSNNNSNTVNNSVLRDQSWKQMVKGLKDGLAKNIGVSNYLVEHLEELKSADYGVKPAVNQVEWHPFHHPQDLLDYCRKEGVLLQAYSSLGGTSTGNTDLFEHENVQEIARKLGKSTAQVLLKWAVQQNIGVIPKASSRNHIEDNINLDFAISEADMTALNNLGLHNKYRPDPGLIA